MSAWQTDLRLATKTSTVIIKNLRIKNSIYQGDLLSPSMFCMALFPLSSIINDTNTGYTCKNEMQMINHLPYVDDLKLVAKDEDELNEQLEPVK